MTAAIALILLASSHSPKTKPNASPSPTPAPKAQTNPDGFPVPDLTGYEALPWPKTGTADLWPEIPGRETLVEAYQNKAGDQQLRMSLAGTLFGVAILPGGDASKGYLLLDPKCEHKMTLKVAPDAVFDPPQCAKK